MATTKTKEETSLLATAGKLTDAVQSKISQMLTEKRLDLPADYSANNALKAMQLAILDCKDRNKQSALSVCTGDSVIQCMLSMVVQGLNPDKKQCYPIVYGNKLTLMRSYFGDIAVAKRVDPEIADIVAQVVYKSEKDGFKMEFLGSGKALVTHHIPDIFGSRTIDDVVGAYCTVSYKDGTAWSEFRTFEQIKDAWKHSQVSPVNADGSIKKDSTHYREYEDMCRRTVVKRACKQIINSSSDSSIVAQFARETERDMEKAEAEERIDMNLSSGETVDIEFEVVGTTPSDATLPETDETAQVTEETTTTEPASEEPQTQESNASEQVELGANPF